MPGIPQITIEEAERIWQDAVNDYHRELPPNRPVWACTVEQTQDARRAAGLAAFTTACKIRDSRATAERSGLGSDKSRAPGDATESSGLTIPLIFVECDTCRAKPGSPLLCKGCLYNRRVIEWLTKVIEQARP